ncbi:hypothetical protein [Lentzea sp. NBRC 102530]|uniref:hypothetical protein n=1 Tax=Lentzea sp. NBRC 102530 TaxID=3032201 RepID=UPI0024A43A68|nr:hypothetical protein [Lentzea sp. NBRC 102530]GLY54092.1 hypothetical protein Lesp01_77480 [Lentzea sp. NBRC 102530]
MDKAVAALVQEAVPWHYVDVRPDIRLLALHSVPGERADLGAARVPTFLNYAVPSACLAAGWLFAVLWTWSARLRGVYLGCPTEEAKNLPICLSSTPQSDVALTVTRDFGLTFRSVLAPVVAAAALVVPRFLHGR